MWRGLYKEEVVAVKVFISEESDVSSEVKMMAKASGQKNIVEVRENIFFAWSEDHPCPYP